MTKRKAWRPETGAEAARDFAQILNWTEENFGARQARVYDALLRSALRKVARDPFAPPSRARDNDIGAGFRTLHLARPGRHLLLYRAEGECVLIVRILHDSMDIARHLPPRDE